MANPASDLAATVTKAGASGPARPPHSFQIHAAQVKVLYDQSLIALIASALAALLLAAVMWNEIPRPALLFWLALFFANTGFRVHLLVSYRQSAPLPAMAVRWGRLHALGAGLSGVIWGSAGIIMFVPDSLANQALLTTILFAVAAGSAGVYPAHLPSYYAFLLPTLSPIILRTLVESDTLHFTMALMGITVLTTLLVIGRNLHRLMTESVKMSFENLELVKALTDQKAAAEQAKLRAEASDRAKSQFLAAASHDLRQPLHALGLFASVLTQKNREPALDKVIASINASLEALENLFHALLDISRLDAGVVKPSPVEFPVQPILARIESDYSAQAEERNLALKIVPSNAVAYSDPVLIEEILRNFISNAIRYTDNGKVLVGCRRRGNCLRLEVWDTGIGIPETHREKIFEEFYQIGNAGRDRTKGLGLGLAIVKRLADLLNHGIELRSLPGRGSVFALSMPLGDAAASAHAGPAPAHEPKANLSGRLVVVLDDEQAVRDGMKTLLSQWGCEVVAATSAEEAIEAFASMRRSPDVIMADYRLSDGATGSEAIRQLQAQFGKDIPGILITGDTAPDRLSEAAASGYELLHKPVPPAKLRSLLNQMFGLFPRT